MPGKHQNKEKANRQKSAAGGAVQKRSAATGQRLGKRDLKAAERNAENTDKFLTALSAMTSAAEFDRYDSAGSGSIARVVHHFGSQLEVNYYDGRKERRRGEEKLPQVHIAGALKLKGSVSKKADRDNAMLVGDHILVVGGIAAGKFPAAFVKLIEEEFSRLRIDTVPSFFAVLNTQTGEEEEGELEDYFDVDRTEEVAELRAQREAMRLDLQRRQDLRRGTAGRDRANAGAVLAEQLAARHVEVERPDGEEEEVDVEAEMAAQARARKAQKQREKRARRLARAAAGEAADAEDEDSEDEDEDEEEAAAAPAPAAAAAAVGGAGPAEEEEFDLYANVPTEILMGPAPENWEDAADAWIDAI